MIVREDYALGKNGEIQETISKEEFIRRYPHEHFEIKPDETVAVIFQTLASKRQAEEEIRASVSRMYRHWGKFGPHGDVISITQPFLLKNDRIITVLGRRAFQKPALAVDCVIFVRDESGNYFFVGIKRSKDPGKGKAALVGGFIDVDGYDMESADMSTIREVGEELGLEMFVPLSFKDYNSETFTPDEVRLNVLFRNRQSVETTFFYVGDTETGDEEKLERLGKKRVDWTFVYTCLFILPEIQTAETLGEYFKAGSDAAKLVVQPFSPSNPESVRMMANSFGLSHHKKMFLKALKLIREEK